MLANKTDAKSNWVTSLTKANSKTDSYSDGVQGGDINAILSSLNSAKTAADQVSIWQKWLNDINQGTGVYSKYAKNTSVLNNAWKNYSTGYANWLKDAKIPDSISNYTQNAPLDPLPDYMQGYLALDPSNADSVANYQTTLSKSLGNLSDSKGNPLVPAANIALAAKGSPSAFNSLVDSVDKAAYSAATKGTSGLYVTDPKERFNLIKGFMSNPQSIVPLQTPLKITGTGNDTVTGGTGNDTVTGGTKTDTTAGGTGLDTLAKNINPKLLDENGNFRPYLSTWTAPKQGVATNNSPYSGLLDAMLNKVTGANYGTPETNKTYDALTSALTQGIGVDSLPKPKVTYNADNPAGITGLGIDYTGRTLTPLNTQVTSAPSYTSSQIANAKTALDNAKTIAGEKAAAEKAAAEKAKWIQDTQNAYTNPLDYYNALANNTKYEDLAAIGRSSVAQYTPMAAQAAADKAAADRTAWLTNLQNTAKSPQEYYNALANNTQYSDLAAVGKSYVSTPVQTQLQQPQTQTINLGNTGIVTPEVSKFASTGNLNTSAGGIPLILAQDTSAQQTTQSSPQTFTLSSPSQINQQAQSTVASSNQTAQPMSADKTAWLTATQNNAASPQDYYKALAASPYSDLAAIGNQNLSPVTQTAPQTFTLK